MLKVYKVLKQFDSSKDYGLEIRSQHARCLAVMKKGENIDSKAFGAVLGIIVQKWKKDSKSIVDLGNGK